MKKIISLSVIVLAALILLVALFLNKSNGNSDMRVKDIKKSGKIVMGCNANYPPFEFHKNIDGKDKIVGFDVFIAEEIAKDLGVKLEISDMEFSSVLASLDSGVIDLALSGISKTPEREKSILFSKVYYDPKNYLLVNSKDLGKYKDEKSVIDLTIGVQTATIQEEIAKNLKIKNIVSLPKTPDLIAQLNQGLIDGIIVEKSVGDNYELSNKNLKMENSFYFEAETSGTAVGLKKGDDELLEIVNKTLDRLEKEGKLEKYYEDALELSTK
ncbi:transporter substrate-binding domain-containing protein [Peptoniphilus porci]|uniref:Solute-binding protein family 3/N-terminal domain-containing protein n=1 Tax=Peptoniphilus porci TaxID=2652280 RepID=A0A1U7M0C2_9FIRM|nr:transporter substrate-binding domain-containing protein [Peptoniphilus porci]OLR65120.1 hypothetical protein BIV18_06135 [Peptoniphilus porci]